MVFLFTKKYNFLDQSTRLLNLLVHIPVCILFSSLHSIIYAVFSYQIMPSYSERFPSFMTYLAIYVFWGNIYMGIIIYPLIVISINALLFYRNYRQEEAQNAILKAQLAQAQLSALKMQLHPHFLFNTLHSISSLILDNPPLANVMVARLGDFLRLTLEHSDRQMVRLDEEINFLRSYLEIEQIRFQDRLTVKYEIEPEALNAEVPNLILQPLVENAVKHGISPHGKAGEIFIGAQIRNRKLQLRIKDNGVGKNGNGHHKDSTPNGKGLLNVRSRLEQVYGEDFRMIVEDELPTGFEVDLTIPGRLNENNS